MTRQAVSEKYSELTVRYRELKEKESRILLLLSVLRLAAFIAGIVSSVAGFTYSAAAGMIILVVFTALFLLLLNLFSKHSFLKDYYGNLEGINRDELTALSGDFSKFAGGSEKTDPNHDFSHDIDLFGKESLFQYLNRTVTGYGRDILAGWLTDPFRYAGQMKERQEAIRELAARIDWRQNFAAIGMMHPLEESDLKGLLEWLSGKGRDEIPSIYRIIAWLFPLLTVTAIILSATAAISLSVVSVMVIVNLSVTFLLLRKTNRIHDLLSGKQRFLSSFTRILDSVRDEEFGSVILKRVRRELTEGSVSSELCLKELEGIMKRFDSRLNMIAGFTLNALLLWDLHCLIALSGWKAAYSDVVPELLRNTGNLDAYSALAGYSFNNPDYAWPEIADEPEPYLSIVQAGHPLISPASRVCNDFTIERSGTIVIITGANMAGKSTFMRTLAVNYILAMTGAPVCAGAMKFKPVRLFTSMRTADSLSHNESYFYAELRRLKTLRERVENDKQVLFFLDEILKGTNSEDKSRGSRLFLRRCIGLGGTGVIATHDISLAGIEAEYPGTVVNRCFEIEIDGDKVKFDYKLRPGVTTKMNASLLMREMGITD